MANNNNHGSRAHAVIMYQKCLCNLTLEGRRKGCASFEPSGPIRSPGAMVCKACQCHRSFHRRVEVMGSKPPESNKRLTEAQSERVEDVARRNNWKMFRDYSKEEVAEICSEIGIEKRSLKAWIAYHRNKQAIKKKVSK